MKVRRLDRNVGQKPKPTDGWTGEIDDAGLGVSKPEATDEEDEDELRELRSGFESSCTVPGLVVSTRDFVGVWPRSEFARGRSECDLGSADEGNGNGDSDDDGNGEDVTDDLICSTSTDNWVSLTRSCSLNSCASSSSDTGSSISKTPPISSSPSTCMLVPVRQKIDVVGDDNLLDEKSHESIVPCTRSDG